MSLELGKESTHTRHTWHRLGHQMPSVPTQQLAEALGAANSTRPGLGLDSEDSETKGVPQTVQSSLSSSFLIDNGSSVCPHLSRCLRDLDTLAIEIIASVATAQFCALPSSPWPCFCSPLSSFSPAGHWCCAGVTALSAGSARGGGGLSLCCPSAVPAAWQAVQGRIAGSRACSHPADTAWGGNAEWQPSAPRPCQCF